MRADEAWFRRVLLVTLPLLVSVAAGCADEEVGDNTAGDTGDGATGSGDGGGECTATNPIADPVVFFDDTFDPDSWRIQSEAAVGGATHTFSQDTASGNPTHHRRMVNTLPAPVAGAESTVVTVRHELLGAASDGSGPGPDALYDPGASGAIGCLEVSWDRIVHAVEPEANLAGGELFLVYQDGTGFYTNIDPAGTPSGGDTFTNRTWGSTGPRLLRSSDFPEVQGRRPDFSACGSPLSFGYLRGNANYTATPYSIDHGIDNWSVIVHPTCPDEL